MKRLIPLLIMILATLFLPFGTIVPRAWGQSIESSPSKSVQLFFAAVSDRKYDAASKFLPRSVLKVLDREFPGGFEAFIDSIAKENEGNKLEIESESIEDSLAKVETITITASGKRISEKWTLRLEDNLWKLDILIPR